MTMSATSESRLPDGCSDSTFAVYSSEVNAITVASMSRAARARSIGVRFRPLTDASMSASPARISLRFTASRFSQLGSLTPLQEEFFDGRGDADLEGPIILLVPPGGGPKVNVLPTSPPPLATREMGEVEVALVEPYNGLVPDGTVAPGLYQRFTLAGGGGPPWIVVVLFFFGLVALSRFLLRALLA